MRRRGPGAPPAERNRAKKGKPIGRIELPTLGRHYVVVQGTDDATLRKGPGHYPGTEFPGEGKTVAIAGHRTTYLAPFRTINKLKRGNRIVLKMPYATFTYSVEKTQVVGPNALWITHNVRGEERLVLSACHPLYSASHRIVAFARLIGGQGRAGELGRRRRSRLSAVVPHVRLVPGLDQEDEHDQDRHRHREHREPVG